MRFARPALLILLLAIAFASQSSRASSFGTFASVYGQVTNEIALVQAVFDGAPAQKQRLAALLAARESILNPSLADEQVLDRLVTFLGAIDEYDVALASAAQDARDSVLARDFALGERIDLLPPSPRTTRARSSYNELAGERSALLNAGQAGAIAAQLAPYGRRLTSISELADRASVLPRPKVGADNVRAQIDARRFSSGPNGTHSPNVFSIDAVDPLYSELYCRVVDKEKVISFTLPVITSRVDRYEIEHGLATLTYTLDVFASNAVPQSATAGTFWVQSVEGEIYGIFSCEGPGFQIRDGRFRIKTNRKTL
jgi:hypothetical protein